ncbi:MULTISPECIES: non-ribosomal peptide synthetase [unclassified Bacillus cereus group]|uniref:non-ribosomal peptide synthetase n=1 Tax=unclassified Bacillus cereus group TaxID=2750818 RepID=UPI001F57587D|nr:MULTISPECIES: non-ribosomal peptide synthetase [unclassified Bacillus cereus group]
MESNLIRNERYWVNFPFEKGWVSQKPVSHDNVLEKAVLKSYDIQVPLHVLKEIQSLTKDSPLLIYTILVTAVAIQGYLVEGVKELPLTVPIFKSEVKNDRVEALPFFVTVSKNLTVKKFISITKNILSRNLKFRNVKLSNLPLQVQKSLENWCANSMYICHKELHNIGSLSKETLVIENEWNTMKLLWKYNSLKYTEDVIQKKAEQLVYILEQMVENINNPIQNLQGFPIKEREKLLNLSKGLPVNIKEDPLQFFDDFVYKSPQQIAIIEGEKSISYGELQEKIEGIKEQFVKKRLKKGERIAIEVHRNIETIVLILAAIRFQLTYIPIDSTHPKERNDWILENSKAKYLLSIEKEKGVQFKSFSPKNENPVQLVKEEELICYIMYTSGTTGKPKGVPIKLNAVTNVCQWYKRTFEINQESKVLLLNPLTFDASVKNIITPLMAGGTIILGPEYLYNIREIVQKIARFKVTHLNSVPVLMDMILEEQREMKYKGMRSVKYMVIGGDIFQSQLILHWLNETESKCRIANVYGPTECTIISTVHWVTREEMLQNESIPIGRPIDNMYAYVLNEEGFLCPFGEHGELFLSGVGVAKGYLEDNVVSEKKFIENVFQPGSLMYKTGDLVKYSESGELLFLGRKDDQIKLNGYRIEPKEIENLIQTYPGIKRNVIKLIKDKKKVKSKLVAFIESQHTIDTKELAAHLSAFLPGYMVPSHFVIYKEFPVNSHGKIARDKLEMIDEEMIVSNIVEMKTYIDVEKQLLYIWKEVLNIRKMNVDDHPFDKGASSIELIEVLQKMKQKKLLDDEFTILDFFEYPTISSLAKKIYVDKKNNLK